MNSMKNINSIPTGTGIYSDDIIEFHASRLLLLINICGKKEKKSGMIRLSGLTKLAKLDFFIRYPKFFRIASEHLNKEAIIERQEIESQMIRFHYGPWDERYYQVLPFLEARGLIKLSKDKSTYELTITEKGINISNELSSQNEFRKLVNDIKEVKKVLGKFSGTKLKNLVYELFDDEVSKKRLKDIIGDE